MNRAYEFSKQRISQMRRRVRLRHRLSSGFTELFHHPVKLILPAVILISFRFVYSRREDIPFPESIDSNQLLLKLYMGIFTVFLAIIAVLLPLGVLYIIGTPRGAQNISDKLYQIRLTDRYGFPPILISRRRAKHSDVERMTFFSLGIDKGVWEQHKQAIEDVLNVHFKEPIQYDKGRKNERNYIVLVVVPGVERKREELLYDDEL